MITCVTEAHVANAYTAIHFAVAVLLGVILWHMRDRIATSYRARRRRRRWP